ncbi:MAG: LytR C-terminal domain-containing protein [Ilumatobacteraceae bacterium]|nr:LytR C-terminal domain-containing protein [Ilumatobacteraceae bacterium]
MSRRRLTAAACALTLAVAACGGSDDVAEPAPTPAQATGDPATAGTVIVANANIDDGSAGRMADALSLAGFTTGAPVTASEKIDRSVVFYVNTDGAAETARQVGKAMGGLPVLSLLDDKVWTESGTLDGGTVLVLLGQNEADRTLAELTGGSGGGGSGSSGGGGSSTTDGPIGGPPVQCAETAIRAGLEGGSYEIVNINSLDCADGWAVAGLEVTSDGGATTQTITEILEAEGQFWIRKDASAVCGTGPDDAEVPASLYPQACPGLLGG